MGLVVPDRRAGLDPDWRRRAVKTPRLAEVGWRSPMGLVIEGAQQVYLVRLQIYRQKAA